MIKWLFWRAFANFFQINFKCSCNFWCRRDVSLMSCGRLQRSSSIDSMVEAAAWSGDVSSPMGPLSPSASPCSSHSGPAATRQRAPSPLMMAPPRLLLLSPSVGRRTKFDNIGASGQSHFFPAVLNACCMHHESAHNPLISFAMYWRNTIVQVLKNYIY